MTLARVQARAEPATPAPTIMTSVFPATSGRHSPFSGTLGRSLWLCVVRILLLLVVLIFFLFLFLFDDSSKQKKVKPKREAMAAAPSNNIYSSLISESKTAIDWLFFPSLKLLMNIVSTENDFLWVGLWNDECSSEMEGYLRYATEELFNGLFGQNQV